MLDLTHRCPHSFVLSPQWHEHFASGASNPEVELPGSFVRTVLHGHCSGLSLQGAPFNLLKALSSNDGLLADRSQEKADTQLSSGLQTVIFHPAQARSTS